MRHLGLLVLAACGHHERAAAPPTALAHSVRAPLAAPPSAPNERFDVELPHAECAIAGHALSIDRGELDLCGAPGRACFGRLRASSDRSYDVRSLAIDPSLAARIVVSRGGVTVRGIVDARAMVLHSRVARLAGGWFVPELAPLRVDSVTAHTLEASVDTGAAVSPSSPLSVEWPCSDYTLDASETSVDAVEHLLHLAGVGRPLEPTTDGVDVRSSPEGPVVARVHPRTGAVRGYDVSHRATHVLIPTDGGYVVGWVDEHALVVATHGSHAVRAPRLFFGARPVGSTTCDHPVAIEARVGNDVVDAATIAPGVAFDPADAAGALSLVVELAPPAVAEIRVADVKDCRVQ